MTTSPSERGIFPGGKCGGLCPPSPGGDSPRGISGQKRGGALALVLAVLAGHAAAQDAIPDGWRLGVIGYKDGSNEFGATPAEAGEPRVAVFVRDGIEGTESRALIEAFPFEVACRTVAALLADLGEPDIEIEIRAMVQFGGRVLTLSRSESRRFSVVGGTCVTQGGTDL